MGAAVGGGQSSRSPYPAEGSPLKSQSVRDLASKLAPTSIWPDQLRACCGCFQGLLDISRPLRRPRSSFQMQLPAPPVMRQLLYAAVTPPGCCGIPDVHSVESPLGLLHTVLHPFRSGDSSRQRCSLPGAAAAQQLTHWGRGRVAGTAGRPCYLAEGGAAEGAALTPGGCVPAAGAQLQAECSPANDLLHSRVNVNTTSQLCLQAAASTALLCMATVCGPASVADPASSHGCSPATA